MTRSRQENVARFGHRPYVRGEGGDWYAACEDCGWVAEWRDHASDANRDAEQHREETTFAREEET